MSEKVLGAGIQRRGNLHQDGMLDHVGGNFWAELWDSRAFKRQRLKGSMFRRLEERKQCADTEREAQGLFWGGHESLDFRSPVRM